MGQINILVGNPTSPEYYGTYDVAYKRYTRIYLDPIFLDTHYGALGAYTLQECIDNGWLDEDDFYFVYQFETILDFSEIINNGFCRDIPLSWEDLSITSLTRESSASIIYENGYIYLRTLIDVELSGIPNLFVSFTSTETVDHTDHTHPQPTYVYDNIDWNLDGDKGETNPDEGETNPDEGSGIIKPDDSEHEPFNSEWCELGYDIYVARCDENNLEPCSYDYWTGRANILVDTYAHAYAEYTANSNEDFQKIYENYVTNINGHSDGWSMVMLYQMYCAEYVSYDYQELDDNSSWIRPFDGLKYDAWLEWLDAESGQAAYDLYVNSETVQEVISYDDFIKNSKTTYSSLIAATGLELEGDNNGGSGAGGNENKAGCADLDQTLMIIVLLLLLCLIVFLVIKIAISQRKFDKNTAKKSTKKNLNKKTTSQRRKS